MGSATLFVANVSPLADESYLKHLFGVYGRVLSATEGSVDGNKIARVVYQYADDADCAVAALHLKYRMIPNLPLLVFYDKASEVVTDYGRSVGRHYKTAMEGKRTPSPKPLVDFDPAVPRSQVEPPPNIHPAPGIARDL